MVNNFSMCPPQGWCNGGETEPLHSTDAAEMLVFGRKKTAISGYFDWLRQIQGAWQVLEEERLGSALVKAWKGKYESAEAVMTDVKWMPLRMGLDVEGDDEIVLGNGVKWEDALEVVTVRPSQRFVTGSAEIRFTDKASEACCKDEMGNGETDELILFKLDLLNLFRDITIWWVKGIDRTQIYHCLSLLRFNNALQCVKHSIGSQVKIQGSEAYPRKLDHGF